MSSRASRRACAATRGPRRAESSTRTPITAGTARVPASAPVTHAIQPMMAAPTEMDARSATRAWAGRSLRGIAAAPTRAQEATIASAAAAGPAARPMLSRMAPITGAMVRPSER